MSSTVSQFMFQAPFTFNLLIGKCETPAKLNKGRRDQKRQKCNPKNNKDTETNTLISITITRVPIVFKGNYKKFRRDVSQTKWLLADEETKVTTSVEECIGTPLCKAFNAIDYNLHAAGREDVDVRMLGCGRPFVCVLKNPKNENPRKSAIIDSILSVPELQQLVNEFSVPFGVEISDLKIEDDVVNTVYKDIQKLGEEKKKEYACVCRIIDGEINEKLIQYLNDLTKLDVIEILQKTPLRVAHRRSLAARKKIIFSLKADLLSPTLFALRLVTEAGTYIKEFVHSDFGRTTPSVTSLLGHHVDLVQLDVINLHLETPT